MENATACAAATDVGFLQVNADPGIEVYIDGASVGTTSGEVGGLFVLDVPAGERLVRLETAGFEVREQVKSRDVWMVEQVPDGSYGLTVSALGREVQVDVVVVDRHETRLFVALGSDPPLITSETRPIPPRAVERLAPDVIRSSQNRQRIAVHGRGFRPGAVVFVSWGDNEFEIPPERTAFVDEQRIDVEVGLFPADTDWSVVVVDPDGTRSEPFLCAVVD